MTFILNNKAVLEILINFSILKSLFNNWPALRENYASFYDQYKTKFMCRVFF